MNPDRWKRIDTVFQSALERTAAERTSYLDEACEGDDDLRREVEQLLSADRHAGDFIEAIAVEAAAQLFAAGEGAREGMTIAHYRVESRIAAGGMGDVYRAVDSRDGDTVALKLLPATLTSDTQLRARFLREARLASALDHPNVCRIREVGRADDQLFIAMELVEGKTLKQIVADGPLALDVLLSIAIQTADAIAAAHREGIVHRDVKSSNVVVTAAGRAKVLDFGLAKLLDAAVASGSVLTRPGTVLGTPAYMSPEQARGEPADHRSDIFSLGVVLYEMAAGRLPFERRSQAATLTAVVHELHEPLEEVRSGLPPALSTVVDRALEKSAAHRYPTMDAMLEALRAVGQ